MGHLKANYPKLVRPQYPFVSSFHSVICVEPSGALYSQMHGNKVMWQPGFNAVYSQHNACMEHNARMEHNICVKHNVCVEHNVCERARKVGNKDMWQYVV